MQEIKKRRIVLASVLKPVNDPRMFEKLGQSLSHHYEVHVIGTAGVVETKHPDIFFHPLTAYTRLSVNRILSPIRILKKVLALKPDLLIISTHELLWMVLVAKIFLDCKVVYDIRENYLRNILYTNAFPPIVRVFIALYVRIKEWITAPWINIFFLAEAGYEKELKFIGNRKVVIENKVKKIQLPETRKWSDDDHCIHLLFSGTLAPTTGVFIAIHLASKLHAVDPRVRLHIIGFSPLASVRHDIQKSIQGKEFISFPLHHEPISHTEILRSIQQADAGIVAYPPNLSTENTIPTKLYEYLGYRLPIVLIHKTAWASICEPFEAAVLFDPHAVNAPEILDRLQTGSFYTTIPTHVFWEFEEERLFKAVSDLQKK
jgi:glycosyltransferase involved in cell wall biosynthesis